MVGGVGAAMGGVGAAVGGVGAAVGGAGRGAAVGGVGVGAGAALWWWRVAPPCRRHGRASQTLEFNERLALRPAHADLPDTQGTVPRARRVLRVAVAARGGVGAVGGVGGVGAAGALSASCGTIDAPPPRVLLLPRWRAPPLPAAPPASRSYHLLPESQRAPLRYRGARRACCEADDADEADEAEEDAWDERDDDDGDEPHPHRPD